MSKTASYANRAVNVEDEPPVKSPVADIDVEVVDAYFSGIVWYKSVVVECGPNARLVSSSCMCQRRCCRS